MQVLNDNDQALFSQLVRLARGNSELVVEVLSQPERRRMTLTTVMDEIERLRDQATPATPAHAGATAAE